MVFICMQDPSMCEEMATSHASSTMFGKPPHNSIPMQQENPSKDKPIPDRCTESDQALLETIPLDDELLAPQSKMFFLGKMVISISANLLFLTAQQQHLDF